MKCKAYLAEHGAMNLTLSFHPKFFGNIFESTHFWLTQDLLQSYSSSPFPSFGKSASHKGPKKIYATASKLAIYKPFILSIKYILP